MQFSFFFLKAADPALPGVIGSKLSQPMMHFFDKFGGISKICPVINSPGQTQACLDGKSIRPQIPSGFVSLIVTDPGSLQKLSHQLLRLAEFFLPVAGHIEVIIGVGLIP